MLDQIADYPFGLHLRHLFPAVMLDKILNSLECLCEDTVKGFVVIAVVTK